MVDLSTPPLRETGAPTTFEPPADPGEHRLGIAPGVFLGPASGRLGDPDAPAIFELGAQVHLSFMDSNRSQGRGAIGYPSRGWGVSVGWAVAQIGEHVPTVMGPVHLEGTYHFYALSLGAGVAVYPTPGQVAGGRAEGVDVGGQVTIACWPYLLRMRYVQDSGFEIAGVAQIELPTSITWSR